MGGDLHAGVGHFLQLAPGDVLVRTVRIRIVLDPTRDDEKRPRETVLLVQRKRMRVMRRRSVVIGEAKRADLALRNRRHLHGPCTPGTRYRNNHKPDSHHRFLRFSLLSSHGVILANLAKQDITQKNNVGLGAYPSNPHGRAAPGNLRSADTFAAQPLVEQPLVHLVTIGRPIDDITRHQIRERRTD